MNVYDIVKISSAENPSLPGKNAFVTRLPIGSKDSYTLFFTGDKDVPAQFLLYSEDPANIESERDRVGSIVTEIIQEDSLKNPYDTIVETLDITEGSFIAGVPIKEPTKTHPLRVIRISDDHIIVTRTDDPTETPIRIPLQQGIGEYSPYGFLKHITFDEDGPEYQLTKEKQEFVEKMEKQDGIEVVYTRTPVIEEKIEIPIAGGTRDITRITGQIVGAIRSFSTKQDQNPKVISDLIRDTTYTLGDTRILKPQEIPIMVRSKMELPPWVIRVDNSRPYGIVDDTVSIPGGDTPTKKLEYHLYNRVSNPHLRIPEGKGKEVKKRAEFVFEPKMPFSKNKYDKDGEDFMRKRILLPSQPNECMKNPNITAFRLADRYIASSGLILSSHSYVPPSAPIYLRLQETPWVSPNIINPDDFVETKDPRKMSSLPEDIIKDDTTTLAAISPNLETLMKQKMVYGGLEEIGIIGVKYGFDKHGIHTHHERKMISAHLGEISRRFLKSLTTTDGKIRFINPKGLYSSTDKLQKIYPETLGLINKYEALHRIIQIVGDHGSVLYGMLGADEYSKMESVILSIVKESEGERRTIREEMAKIKTELQDLESKLRSLPKIAKHYSSRKDIELANKGSDIPLWDEHLDDDPDREMYYSDRKREIVSKLIGEMNSRGELDLTTRVAEPGATEICNPPDIGVSVPKEKLLEEIRESYEKQNASLPDSHKIKGSRFDKLVLRTMYGGRPVESGDVALITRYLRTAAFRWNGDTKKWVAIKDDEDVFAGNDIQPKGQPTKIFTHTLHLNKRYRQLSKMKDDKELLMRQPEISTNPEKIKASLETLLESVSKLSDNRLRYLGRNPIIDEILFIHDRVKDTMERYSYDNTPIPEDGEDDGRITKSEYRRARMKDELVTDMDLELYQAGLGAYYGETPKDGDKSAAIMPDTDEDDELLSRRFGDTSFLKEVRGRELYKRVFISSIAFAEVIFGVPLTRSEIKICSSDFEVIIPKKTTNSFIIQRGISMYLILIATRMDSPVLLKNTEGKTPPPASKTLPSYRVPMRESDSLGIIDFAVNVILSSIKKEIKGTRKSTFRVIQTALAKMKLGNDSGKSFKNELKKGTIIISRISPSVIIRSIKVEEVPEYDEMIVKGLKITRKWESLPITHNPHPLSDLLQTSQTALSKIDLILKTTEGESIANNAGMPTNIRKPMVKNILEKIHTTSSERLREIFYALRKSKEGHSQSNVSTTQFRDLLGVPPMKVESVATAQEKIEILKTDEYPDFKEYSFKETEKEKLVRLIEEYIEEQEYGVIKKENLLKRITRGLQYKEDNHGALRSGFIAFHEALGLATEQLIRIYGSVGEPISCEKSLYPKMYEAYQSGSLNIPIYTAREVVSGLLKGIPPMSIEYSKTTHPMKGGSRYTLLTGKETYFHYVRVLVNTMTELGVKNLETAQSMRKLVHTILDSIKPTPPTIANEYIYKILNTVLDVEDKTMLNIIEIYLGIISHNDDGKDVFTNLCNTAYQHTDLDDAKIQEELNYDREKERQIFIFQMELLKDKEERNIVRAKRALGLDLAGVVARDPKKFNAEYYILQDSIRATQEMSDVAPERRTTEYGDAEDYALERDAVDGAFAGVEQIEGIDYDE